MEIGVIVVVGLVIAFAAFRAYSTHFICPKCGTSFRVNPLIYIVSAHSFNKRLVKCPNCGRKDFMKAEWGKE